MIKELIGAGFAEGNDWINMLNILVRLDYCLGAGDTEAAKRELEAGLYYTKCQINATERYLRLLSDHVGYKKEEPKKLSQSEMSETLKRVNEERRKFLDENKTEDNNGINHN